MAWRRPYTVTARPGPHAGPTKPPVDPITLACWHTTGCTRGRPAKTEQGGGEESEPHIALYAATGRVLAIGTPTSARPNLTAADRRERRTPPRPPRAS